MTTYIKQIYDIQKVYPKMKIILVFRSPIIIEKNKKSKSFIDLRLLTQEEINKIDDSNVERSLRRSRSMVRDYVFCNDFDYFVTFTFNPKKIDRFSVDSCFSRLNQWCNRQRVNARLQNKTFRYIIIPEFHKNGAIHFHGLIKDYPSSIIDSGVVQDNKRVYNLKSFKYGFTIATEIDNTEESKEKTAYYITKYLTKDMVKIHGRKRYFSSRSLSRPEIIHNAIKHNPEIQQKFLISGNLVYQNQIVKCYKIYND